MQYTNPQPLDFDELKSLGLTRDPFDDPDEPDNIWLPPHLQFLEAKLKTSIQRRQIAILSAPCGSGKSVLIRRLSGLLVKRAEVRPITIASLDRSTVSHTTLAVAILRDLTGRNTTSMLAEDRGELLRVALSDQTAAGRFPVMVIDEGHLLRPKALLAIKHVWDSHVLFRQLAVIIVGQEPLATTLAGDPTVREVYGRAQMLAVPPLTKEQAGDYLRWRFARVGGEADRHFDAGAYEQLALRAGRPLWINNLAVAALHYAIEHGLPRVTAAVVGRE